MTELTWGAFTARIIVDQLDNVNFPHEGYFGWITLYSSLKDVGADDNYNKMLHSSRHLPIKNIRFLVA